MTDPLPWAALPPHMWGFTRFRLEVQRLVAGGEIEAAHALAEAYVGPGKIQVSKEESTQ